jgi:hypothetical protein
MFAHSVRLLATGGIVALLAGSPAAAQSTANFDTLPTGTIVSTQYGGLTVTAVGGTGNPVIQATAVGFGQVGTAASGTTFLAGRVESTSCPTLRLTFTNLQRQVTFKTGTGRTLATPPPLGGDGQTITVQAFDSSGVLVPGTTTTILVTAANSGRLDQLVTLNSPTSTRTISRVDLTARDNTSAGLCRQTFVDDLTFCDTLNGSDPTASLSSPTDFSCVCPGSNVLFQGTIDSGPCGGYAADILEYRALAATTWTIATGPFSSLPGNGDSYTGGLYSWIVPTTLASGYYYFRTTTHNDAGRSGSDVVLLYVDHSPPSFSHMSPATGAIVRGTVCLVGEESDGPCGANYAVTYTPPGGGLVSVPIADAVWPNLANWSTVGLATGTYTLTITGTDACSNTTSVARTFIIDNIPPVARIDSPARCTSIRGVVTVHGEATDVHLASWALQYTGGDSSGWVTIASGSAPVASGGVLGTWNTAGLRSCAYTLRLLVSDGATDNCAGGGNSAEYAVSVDVGCAADFNHSGGVEVQDIFDMLSAWFAGCP